MHHEQTYLASLRIYTAASAAPPSCSRWPFCLIFCIVAFDVTSHIPNIFPLSSCGTLCIPIHLQSWIDSNAHHLKPDSSVNTMNAHSMHIKFSSLVYSVKCACVSFSYVQQYKKSSKMAIEKQLSCTDQLRMPPYIFLETLGKCARDELCLIFTISKLYLNSYRFRILVPIGACCESYFWLPPASVERKAVIRVGERCVPLCKHCNAAIGILN